LSSKRSSLDLPYGIVESVAIMSPLVNFAISEERLQACIDIPLRKRQNL